MKWSLRFDPRQIEDWAAEYAATYDEEVESLALRIQERRCLDRDDLLTLCRWKSPRNQKWPMENDRDYVTYVTKAALRSDNEQFRIEALILLQGVGWPTASVILHFGFDNLYPILDVRALWSVSVEDDYQYNFELWWSYTKFCRRQAKKAKVSMRTLDRALWAYSKKEQGDG